MSDDPILDPEHGGHHPVGHGGDRGCGGAVLHPAGLWRGGHRGLPPGGRGQPLLLGHRPLSLQVPGLQPRPVRIHLQSGHSFQRYPSILPKVNLNNIETRRINPQRMASQKSWYAQQSI